MRSSIVKLAFMAFAAVAAAVAAPFVRAGAWLKTKVVEAFAYFEPKFIAGLFNDAFVGIATQSRKAIAAVTAKRSPVIFSTWRQCASV